MTARKAAPFVIGVLALVLACGSAATAGALITSANIKDNSIRSRDIRNGTIKAKDIGASARSALRGKRGPSGPAGPRGASGPVGPRGMAGVPGVSGYQVVYKTFVYDGAQPQTQYAYCPAGKNLLGGFAPITNGAPDPFFFRYFVVGGGTGLAVQVILDKSDVTVEAQLICARVA